MPQIHVVERDYKTIYDKMTALGPNAGKQPIGTKGISWSAEKEYEQLKSRLGVVQTDSIAKGCPDIKEAINAAEAVLTLSSTTNGHMAVKAWEALENKRI